MLRMFSNYLPDTSRANRTTLPRGVQATYELFWPRLARNFEPQQTAKVNAITEPIIHPWASSAQPESFKRVIRRLNVQPHSAGRQSHKAQLFQRCFTPGKPTISPAYPYNFTPYALNQNRKSHRPVVPTLEPLKNRTLLGCFQVSYSEV